MDHQISLNKAQLLYSAGRYEKMAELLLPVCALGDQGEKESAYLLLAYAALVEDKSRQAIEFAEKALGAGLDTLRLRCCAGIAFHNAGLYRRSLSHLQIALGYDPEDVQVLTVLAQCCFNLEQYESAQRHAQKAVELAPEDAEPITVLAVVRHNLGKPKEALSLLDRALALDPNSTTVLGFRAELEKDDAKSAALLKSLLHIDPGHSTAARQYRRKLRQGGRSLDWGLMAGFSLLSLALLIVPKLLEVRNPGLYLWLYVPAALIVGRSWRRSLPFFLLNFALLSQVEGAPWPDWNPVEILFISMGFSLKFFVLHLLLVGWGRNLFGKAASFREHLRQGTLRVKFQEQAGEMCNVDSALILAGGSCLYLALQQWAPQWVGWGVLLPLVLPFKYRLRNIGGFLAALAVLCYADLAILLASSTCAAIASLLFVLPILLLQILMVHRIYLRKVRYGYSC